MVNPVPNALTGIPLITLPPAALTDIEYKNLSAESLSDFSRCSSVSLDEASRCKLRTAYRKIDLRLLLWYCASIVVLRMSRTNITNADIINLEQGTGIKAQLGNLTATQWSWGMIGMCQAFVKNFAGLLSLRTLSGIAEAGFLPGVIYHMAFWYPANRMPLRLAIFYGCMMLSGTISGLLSYAISFMNNDGGLAGWKWMFLLEGAPAILLTFIGYFCLPNYPEHATFLTATERELIIESVPTSQPKGGSDWVWSEAWAVFKDLNTYLFTAIWFFHAVGGCGVTMVLPTVVHDLGLEGTAISQLMAMPPYALGCGLLILVGWLVEKKWLNGFKTAVVLEIITATCYIALCIFQQKWVKYILIMIAIICSVGVFPILWPDRIRLVKGTTVTGIAIALTEAGAQFSGILGPYLYHQSLGPTYRISFGISTGLVAAAVACMIIAWFRVRQLDARTVRISTASV